MRSSHRPLSLFTLALITSFLVQSNPVLARRSRILTGKSNQTKSHSQQSSLKSSSQNNSLKDSVNSSQRSSQVQYFKNALNTGQIRNSQTDVLIIKSQKSNEGKQIYNFRTSQRDFTPSVSSQSGTPVNNQGVNINNSQGLRKFTKHKLIDMESHSSSQKNKSLAQDIESNLSDLSPKIKNQKIKKSNIRYKATSNIIGENSSNQQILQIDNSMPIQKERFINLDSKLIQNISGVSENLLDTHQKNQVNHRLSMPLKAHQNMSIRSANPNFKNNTNHDNTSQSPSYSVSRANQSIEGYTRIKSNMGGMNQFQKKTGKQILPSNFSQDSGVISAESVHNIIVVSNLDSNNRKKEKPTNRGIVSNELNTSKILNMSSVNLSNSKISGTGLTSNFAENLDEEQIILPNPLMKYENGEQVEGSTNDVDEDTMFGQSINIKNGTIVGSQQNISCSTWRPNRIIANIIYIFLVVSGLYCCFLGFRFFKLTMILLGLDLSYYFVILFLSEFDIYDADNVGHQLGVFFGSLVLGFAISIIAYLYRGSQFIIIGITIGSMVAVFVAQFFIDFEENSDKITILIIYLAASLIFSIAAYASQHSTLIWGTVIVGSILATINFGVLLDDFKSFEHREKLPADRYSDCVNYLIANAILICLGLLFQFYMKNKIISRLKQQDPEMDSDMYSVRATTFL